MDDERVEETMKRRDFLKGVAVATWAAIWGVMPSDVIKVPTPPTDKQEPEVVTRGDEDAYDDYLSHPYFLEGGWRRPSQISLIYVLLDANTSIPLVGERLFFTADSEGFGIVWAGTTDTFGIARDVFGNLPYLDIGKYWVWQKHGDNPAFLKDVVFNY